MVVASHYVFKDMKRLLDRGDTEGLRDATNRYREIYCEDAELQELSERIKEHLLSENWKSLEELRGEIRELERMRQLQTSGGSRVWFR